MLLNSITHYLYTMIRYLLIGIFVCLLAATGYGQQTFKAKVLENKTRVALTGIRVRNIKSNQTAMTDNNGEFSIKAVLNDLIVLSGFSYQNDTVLVTSFKPIEIFLEPQGNLLKQVNIYNPNVDVAGLAGATKDFHNQSVVYQRNGDGSYKGGVALRVWSNNSGERERRKESEYQFEQETRLEIDKVFTEANLAKYLPLKPEELAAFRILYIPSVKVYTDKAFNLTAYINNCYKEFVKLPPEKRVAAKLPVLN
jgi:hypothetical protein